MATAVPSTELDLQSLTHYISQNLPGTLQRNMMSPRAFWLMIEAMTAHHDRKVQEGTTVD